MGKLISIRQFYIAYKIRGNKTRFEFDVGADGSCRDCVSALQEFHRHMQRARVLPPESYALEEIFSLHKDGTHADVRMVYNLPKGPNPDVRKAPLVKPEKEPSLFRGAEAKRLHLA